MIKLEAHRGVANEYPENTLAAFRAAIEQGYSYIELDPKYTSDGKFVLLHDRTLGRTCLCEDGSPADAAIADITLEEARRYDAGSKQDKCFAGERLPTLGEVLELVGGCDCTALKFDNVWESFPEPHRTAFLRELAESGEKKLGLTCATLENMRAAAELVPGCELHYDGRLDDGVLEQLAELSKKGNRVTVWLCIGNEITSWYTGPRASLELCEKVKRYVDGVGVWLLTKREELKRAVEYGVDIVETDGSLKLADLAAVVAEM